MKKALAAANIPDVVGGSHNAAQDVREADGRPPPIRCSSLMNDLEDHDDVKNVYANFDIPKEIIESCLKIITSFSASIPAWRPRDGASIEKTSGTHSRRFYGAIEIRRPATPFPAGFFKSKSALRSSLTPTAPRFSRSKNSLHQIRRQHRRHRSSARRDSFDAALKTCRSWNTIPAP